MNVVFCCLSKSYSTVVTSLPVMMTLDDTMPLWWDKVRETTQALWHTASGSYWPDNMSERGSSAVGDPGSLSHGNAGVLSVKSKWCEWWETLYSCKVCCWLAFFHFILCFLFLENFWKNYAMWSCLLNWFQRLQPFTDH